MEEAFITGFITSLGLILAIGAQNAYVLRSGIAAQHVFLISTICAFSDALLIALGIWGVDSLTQTHPALTSIALYAGAAFVLSYGFLRILAFFRPQQQEIDQKTTPDWRKTILITLAFTWLNPHVYLDTFFLIGSISTQFTILEEKFIFGAGAIIASFSFFYALGYGAKSLSKVFRTPKLWKYVDLSLGISLIAIGIQLLRKA